MSGLSGAHFTRPQRFAVIAGAAVAVFLLLLVLLPEAIRYGAIHWLENHGVEKAEIADVDLNPFAGTFAIEGLGADDGLRIGRLAVEIDWWPMRQRTLELRSLSLNGVDIDLHQSADGRWQLATIVPDKEEKPVRKSETAEASGPWHVILNRIDIGDVNLRVRGKADEKAFDAAVKLDLFSLRLQKRGSDASQTFDVSLQLGKSSLKGFGLNVNNRELKLSNKLLLPPIGGDMAKGVKIGDLNLNAKAFDLGAEDGSAQLLSFAGLALVKADITADGAVAAESLRVDGLQAALHKRKDGKIAVVDSVVASDDKKSAGEQKDMGAKEGGAVPVRIGEFDVSAGSSFAYRDESLFPPLDTRVEVETFRLAPVDLSGGEAGLLNAKFKLNKNGSLTAKGELTPSATNPAANLNIDLKNFDMPGLTGFVEADFGHAIKTGQMDLNSKVKIAANKIDAKNRLTIRRLELEKAKQPGKAEAGLGMPLDTALDMLRDDRGDIVMDVPVSGRLDDPNVNASDAINKALVSSMSSGAMTYAKLALQPYGAILMAGEFALEKAKKAAKPKLTPIRFGIRSAKLDAGMSDYAVKIAALMKQKAFRLQVCGIATRLEGGGATSDQPVVLDDEKLLQLADQRSDAVMQAIQAHGIAADRLFTCRPAIDEKKVDAVPRVEMILD